MQDLVSFTRETVLSSRGLPPGADEPLVDRVARLDERMRTMDALTWTMVPAVGAVGLASFVRLLRADPATATPTVVARGVVTTWAVVVVAVAKMWHAQAQHHTSLLKEQMLIQEFLAADSTQADG